MRTSAEGARRFRTAGAGPPQKLWHDHIKPLIRIFLIGTLEANVAQFIEPQRECLMAAIDRIAQAAAGERDDVRECYGMRLD